MHSYKSLHSSCSPTRKTIHCCLVLAADKRPRSYGTLVQHLGNLDSKRRGISQPSLDLVCFVSSDASTHHCRAACEQEWSCWVSVSSALWERPVWRNMCECGAVLLLLVWFDDDDEGWCW